jgi:hypothetical protein
MFATFEYNSSDISNKGYDSLIKIDSNIQSLSWMSKTSIFQNSSSSNNNNSSTTAYNNNNEPIINLAIPLAKQSNNDEDLKFDKELYFQEGWLATGNSNCMVGCTFSTCLTEKQQELYRQRDEKLNNSKENSSSNTNQTNLNSALGSEQVSSSNYPSSPNTTANTSAQNDSQNSAVYNFTRTNFNLRGHKHDVKLVRWNEPYQKLATCDSKGVIYVWIRYEGSFLIILIWPKIE